MQDRWTTPAGRKPYYLAWTLHFSRIDGRRMANGHSQVTVVSPDRRLDLALPDSVPVGDLIAQLLDLCTDHHDRTGGLAWTLRPVGGTGLAWSSSLNSARVRDGAVLELSPRSNYGASGEVEDVRDATEDVVDQSVGSWRRTDTTTVAVLTLTALAWMVLAQPSLWATTSGNGLAVSVAVAGSALWGCGVVARRGRFVAAHALMAVGLAWSGALVIASTAPATLASTTLTHASRATLTATAVVGAAVVVSWGLPRLAAWSAAAAVVFVAVIGWAATDLAGRSTDEAVALGTVLGVLSLGVAPRASLAASGLAQLDYVVRTRGGVDPGTVAATLARSRALLTGGLAASCALTAAGSVWLAIAGSPLQVAHAAAIAGCLILRSRAFSQFTHVLTLVLIGTAALMAQLAAALIGAQPRPTTIAALVLVAAGSLVLAHGGMAAPSDVAAARSRRMLDVTESLTVATLIPLLAANLGVLDVVREMVN